MDAAKTFSARLKGRNRLRPFILDVADLRAQSDICRGLEFGE
jgi:hypothetical protein